MAWGWSHTVEAYDDARSNVHDLPKHGKYGLLTILREWAHYDREQAGKDGSFRLTFNGRRVAKEYLADAVYERMEDFRTCDNGGSNAWACPYGCHTVSFHRNHGGDTNG